MTKTSRFKKCSECGENIYKTSGVWIDWPAAGEHFCNKTCELLFGEKTGKSCFDKIIEVNIVECKKCGKDFKAYLGPADYCEDCAIKFAEQNQKFEKIEKKAWELYKSDIPEYSGTAYNIFFDDAWLKAEFFYEQAKQKQEEANDDTTK